MKHFDHPNVLSLIGVSFDKENNPAMVLPFMSDGDVKAYLSSHRVSEHDVNTLPPVIIFNCNMHCVQYLNNYPRSIKINSTSFCSQCGVSLSISLYE